MLDFARIMHRSAIPFGILLFTCAASAAETVSRPRKVHTPPIRAAQKWNPLWSFGNIDDPAPPEWYRPGKSDRSMMWQMRNPMHNFTHYVVGVSDRETKRTGRFPAHVFAPGGGWNWAVTRARICPLPFISFEGSFGRFYIGWRENGNLGGKINFKRRSPLRHDPPTRRVKS